MAQLSRNQKVGLGACIAAACATAVPIAQQFEGYRGKAYYDPAHILTQCYGETKGVDPSRIYSKDQCATKLRVRMAHDYAPIIAKCLPEMVQNRYVFGSLIDASYNAGPGAVCGSRMARSIHRGDFAGGCNGFYGWRATATDRRTGQHIALKGLQVRRAHEAMVCRSGL